MARKRKKVYGPGKPVTFVDPSMREVVNPRTGEPHVLLNTGKALRATGACELAFFNRPDGLKLAVQRCRDRKLSKAKVCRAGGVGWKKQVRENIAKGMTVEEGAFAPATPVRCLSKQEKKRKRPALPAPMVRHCVGYDVRVDGQRKEQVIKKGEAVKVARALRAKTKKDVLVTKACRASELVWRAP